MRHTTLPTTPWVLPEEHPEVVKRLYEGGLIKCDNLRRLPLKKGGTTDIYINLRNMRSNPDVGDFVADLYARAFHFLQLDRFAEVPQAVSGLAGVVSSVSRLPYITIREEKKEGRATDASIIGDFEAGERVIIIDDVITDGESKIASCKECAQRKLDLLGLMVLVDRQQGWEDHLLSNGVDAEVWAGMTLHDVRRQMIELKYMERCEPETEKSNPLIVALDDMSWRRMLAIADPLRATGCILKVNDALFEHGFGLIDDLSVYGRIMADLKLHDIPNTVKNTCRRLREYDPWAVTVQASGGPEMIKAAVGEFDGVTNVLAVTVLTSIDEKTCEEVYHCRPIEEVRVLAKLAFEAGAHGLVCSPQEVEEMSKTYQGKLFVTPGVRSAGVENGDQARVDTFEASSKSGATHMVGGRQFTKAADPVTEVHRVLSEELGFGLPFPS